MAHPKSNMQVERGNTKIFMVSRHVLTTACQSTTENGSMSFRACYGGTRPHPTEPPRRPRSSWSTGLKPAFPQKSSWAPCGSRFSMNPCRSSYDVKMWTSSTREDDRLRSKIHDTTRHSGASTRDLCIGLGTFFYHKPKTQPNRTKPN
jgi:hypothetical protein